MFIKGKQPLKKKICRTKAVNYSTLTEVLQWVSQQGLDPDEVRFETQEREWSDGYEAVIEYYSLETDEEYATRIADDEYRKAQREVYERRQYEQLRAKYGN